jgi:hypothetical protein
MLDVDAMRCLACTGARRSRIVAFFGVPLGVCACAAAAAGWSPRSLGSGLFGVRDARWIGGVAPVVFRVSAAIYSTSH